MESKLTILEISEKLCDLALKYEIANAQKENLENYEIYYHSLKTIYMNLCDLYCLAGWESLSIMQKQVFTGLYNGLLLELKANKPNFMKYYENRSASKSVDIFSKEWEKGGGKNWND